MTKPQAEAMVRNITELAIEIAAAPADVRQGFIEAIREYRNREWLMEHTPGGWMLNERLKTLADDVFGHAE